MIGWTKGFGVTLIILALLSVLGCGTVEVMEMDGGAGAGGGASTGAGGTGGATCTPDACNICANGAKTPILDGTACGAGSSCGGPMLPSGFGGTYSTIATNNVCQAGVCTAVDTDCRQQTCACNDPQYIGCFVDVVAACKCVRNSGSFCE